MHKPYRAVGLTIVWVALAFVPALHASAAFQAGENLLQNPSFEGDFEGDEGLRAGQNWEYWFVDAEDGCHDHQPEFTASEGHPERNHEGNKATQIGIRDATFTGGVLQVVNGVEAGQNYEFSMWGHVLYSTEATATVSAGPDPRMMVGIDPAGGLNPYATSVRWSEPNWEFDSYFQFSVVAAAQGDTLTVFAYSTQPECLPANFTFWDDASLVATSAAETPAEFPGAPEDRFREVAPEATIKTSSSTFAANSAAPGGGSGDGNGGSSGGDGGTDGGSVEAGGTGSLCFMLYEDRNANGLREVQEPKLAGGIFTLTDGSAVIDTYTTNGENEPHCFSSVPAGDYMLTWRGEGLTATSAAGWGVSLPEGHTLSREFGASTGESSSMGGASDSRLLRSLAIGGGVFLGLLIIGGVVLAVVVSQRKDKNGGAGADGGFEMLDFPDDAPDDDFTSYE